SFTVEARRPDNSVDVSYSGNIVITKASGPGNLSGTTTKAASSGVATFNDLQFDAAGTYTLHANSGSFSEITSSSIVVNSIIAKWTFEAVTTGNTGTTAIVSAGSAVADAGAQTSGSSFSATHSSSSTVWSNPAGNGSTKSVSANNWSVGDYFQFQANTSGYHDIKITFDQTGSNTGPRDFKIQYSTNGSSFTDFTSYQVPNNSGAAIGWTSGSSNSSSSLPYDLSSITALNGLGAVYFRITDNSTTAINGTTVATAGAGRIDNFAVTGTVDNTWLTSGTNDFTSNSNWSFGTAPSSGDNIIIPSGGTQPVLQANTTLGAIVLNGTLGIAANILTINNAITGTGTLSGSASSNLTLAGTTGTISFTSGSRTLNNLTLSSGSASATLGSALDIYGNVQLNSGALNLNHQNLTLKSNASGTATIDQLASDGSNLSNADNVTVERYIPQRAGSANGGRAYRVLTPTVTTSSTIKANWMEGAMNTAVGTNIDPNPGYGVQITGNGGNTNGFDKTASNAPSLYTFTNGSSITGTAGYPAVTNVSTGSTLDAKKGYFLYIRGDRTQDMQVPYSNLGGMPTSATTLRANGAVQKGAVAFTISNNNGDYSLITNPYPAPIDWTLVFGGNSNISTSYKMWDPNSGIEGGFITVDNTGTPNQTSTASRYIQPGEAFFVQSNGTGATVTITESMKAVGNNDNGIFRMTATKESFLTELYLTEANGNRHTADGVLVKYGSYNKNVDADDADDLDNWRDNIAISRGGTRLGLEARPVIKNADTIPLYLSKLKMQKYEFVFTPSNFSNKKLKAELIDNYLGTRTPLSVSNAVTVSFEVSSDAKSSASDRFMVVFGAGKSPVVDVDHTKPLVNVYPNPINGRNINLNFNGLPKGNYNLIVVDNAGNTMMNTSFYHDGTVGAKTFALPAALVPGQYFVNVIGSDNKISLKVIIQ
ncbi:MAG TPA: T9SS type A sorting domain-containing protein, partial [Ferruginibacter sp.]|nr:T9SS type A sorting domain-containing protein [Ferruginibacter sp.]